jgi:type III secretion system HrpB2-like protein
MTDPINAVATVSHVLEAAKTPAPSSPAMDQLSVKFEAMMKQSPHNGGQHAGAEPFSTPPASDGPNAISQVMSKQEAYLKQTMADVDNFSVNASRMSLVEMTAKGMQISRDIGMAKAHLDVAMGVAQGSNKSLQGLLKNS